MSDAVADLFNGLKLISSAFNYGVMWLFLNILHINMDPRIINFLTIIFLIYVFWKFIKKLPLLVILALAFFFLIQFFGLTSGLGVFGL